MLLAGYDILSIFVMKCDFIIVFVKNAEEMFVYIDFFSDVFFGDVCRVIM